MQDVYKQTMEIAQKEVGGLGLTVVSAGTYDGELRASIEGVPMKDNQILIKKLENMGWFIVRKRRNSVDAFFRRRMMLSFMKKY